MMWSVVFTLTQHIGSYVTITFQMNLHFHFKKIDVRVPLCMCSHALMYVVKRF